MMATSELEIVLQHAAKLSPVDKVEVIKRLADSLTMQAATPVKTKQLIYGKYKDYPGKPVDEEDFKLAEWHPTDKELEG